MALIVSPHPLLAAAGRSVIEAPFLDGESVAEFLARQGVRLGRQPWVLQVGGQTVPREWWGRVRPKPGTLVTLRATVHGDGGGGGKNPLQTVLSIALMVVAPGVGNALAGAFGLSGAAFTVFGTSVTWGQLFAGVVSLAGNLLISSMTAAPRPQLSQVSGAAQAEQLSPTYAITGGSNRARPYEPLPVVMGRHRIWADLGSKPYTEFEGDDQVLWMVFNFGLSDVVLSDFKVGETPLADYADWTMWQAGPDGRLPQGWGNVDSIAGAALTQAGGWVTRTSSVDTVALGIDLEGVLYHATASGIGAVTVTHEVEYRPVGAGAWLPGVADSTTTRTHYWSLGYAGFDGWRQIDFDDDLDIGAHVEGESGFLVHGSYGPNGETSGQWHWRAYADILDAAGVPTEPAPPHTVVARTGALALSGASRKPVRRTITIGDLAPGQYEVRIRRTTADHADATYGSAFAWTTLRSYQRDAADYTGQRRVALKIRASGQLNGVVETFNAVGSARCAMWDAVAEEWRVGETSNPAWWFLWFARGYRDAGGRRVFGACLAESRIDVEGLKAWGAWCDAQGLAFDAVWDSARSCRDVLDTIAGVGRGSLSWASGRLGVVWRDAAAPTVAVFGMGNIVRHSFRVAYVSQTLPDQVIARFRNAATGWAQDEVRALAPGTTDPANPVTVELFGVTAETQAAKAANLLAAEQVFHVRRVQWEADHEGVVATRGDVVVMSHDLTQWGSSGRLLGGDGTTLTLDRPVSFTPAASHYVGVRFPNGFYAVLGVVAGVGETRTLTLGEAWPTVDDDGNALATPDTDPDHPAWDYTYVFDPLATPGKRLRIIEVDHGSRPGRIRFTATDEVAAYYDHEDAAHEYTPAPTPVQALPAITALDLTEEWVLAGAGYAVKLIATWDVSGAYHQAAVRYAYAGESLQLLGVMPIGARRAEILVADHGSVQVQVTVMDALGRVDAVAGVASVTRTIAGKDTAVSDVAGFTAQAANGLALLRWSQVADPDYAGVEVRYNALGSEAWADASTVTHVTRGTQITTAILPPGSWTLLAKAHDTHGNTSTTAARADLVLDNPNTIVAQRDEQDWWETGTLDGLLIHGPTRALVPDSTATAQAAGWATFDAPIASPVASGSYTTPAFDLGWDGTARFYGIVTSRLLAGATGVADPDTQLATKLTAGAWGDYTPWDVGLATAREWRLRLVVDTAEGLCAIVAAQPTADAEVRTESGAGLTVAVGGTAVAFGRRFFATPAITVTPVSGTAAGATISAPSATGFTAAIHDAAGTDTGGTANWTARGA